MWWSRAAGKVRTILTCGAPTARPCVVSVRPAAGGGALRPARRQARRGRSDVGGWWRLVDRVVREDGELFTHDTLPSADVPAASAGVAMSSGRMTSAVRIMGTPEYMFETGL